MDSETKAQCVNCGLLLTKNEHPDAGKLHSDPHVGYVYGCLPCAEKRSHGHRRVLSDLKRWLVDCKDEKAIVGLDEVLTKISELDEARRQEFHQGNPIVAFCE